MTDVERLAELDVHASYEVISDTAREQLKIHILDAFDSLVGSIKARRVLDLKPAISRASSRSVTRR
jgi:hypothetical protein